jgi:hypothetical protein
MRTATGLSPLDVVFLFFSCLTGYSWCGSGMKSELAVTINRQSLPSVTRPQVTYTLVSVVS